MVSTVPPLVYRHISFNPHRPRRSGAMSSSDAETTTADLSILTAPEGAVQYLPGDGVAKLGGLSILTAPEGAVQ